MKYGTSRAELSKLQMACLGITGAMKTAPTAAIEVLLGLHPLHLQLEAEARAGIYRLHCSEQWKPKSKGFGHAHMTQNMEKEPIVQKGTDKMILRHVYSKAFMVRFPDRSEWKDGFQPDRKGGLICYTYGSKTNKGTGAGVYGYGTRMKCSFSLGKYTTVFQAEVYAIMACTLENLDRNYKNRNIYILSDSQAALRALNSYQINSKLVWDCHQSLTQLAEHNRVQLIWVPGHEGIEGHEVAEKLAKLGSECPFIGPEPACGISAGIVKKAVRDCTNRNHKKYWESLTGLKQAKGFLQGLSVRRTEELLKLNRNQLRWVTGLLTRHCHLKGHLFKMGLTESPTYERCLEKDESATHILCDCEAIAS
jgi:ribonuclease HI